MAFTPAEEAAVRLLIEQNSALLNLAGAESTIISKLGATKVTLSDIDTIDTPSDTDLMLSRQGTDDKSLTLSKLKAYAQDGAVLTTGAQTVAGEKTFTDLLTAEAGMFVNITARDADNSTYPYGWSAMKVGQSGYPADTALILTYVGERGGGQRVVQFIIDKIGNGFWFRTRNADDTAWEDFHELATTDMVDEKQDTLVSGTNIKTINSTSLLGSGDIAVGFGNAPVYYDKTSVRSLGVTYTNTQPHLMFITFRVWGADAGAVIHVNGVQVSLNDISSSISSAGMTASAVVPVGGTYVYTKSGGSDHQIYEFY